MNWFGMGVVWGGGHSGFFIVRGATVCSCCEEHVLCIAHGLVSLLNDDDWATLQSRFNAID